MTTTPPPSPKSPSNNHNNLTKEEFQILSSLGLSSQDLLSSQTQSTSNTTNSPTVHPLVAAGLGTAFILNLGLLLSLPPVLRGRGAPYLPTFTKNLDVTFEQIRRQLKSQQQRRHHVASSSSSSLLEVRIKRAGEEEEKKNKKKLEFVDLGSGDGRVVFRAAREDLFYKCVGYEINPVLHLWASMRRIIQYPKYYHNTQFHLGDLWKINLSSADVVAVYGLQPIMTKLGSKMKDELKNGSVVVSNVFEIPGWKPTSCDNGVHVYCIPECWDWRSSGGGGGDNSNDSKKNKGGGGKNGRDESNAIIDTN